MRLSIAILPLLLLSSSCVYSQWIGGGISPINNSASTTTAASTYRSRGDGPVAIDDPPLPVLYGVEHVLSQFDSRASRTPSYYIDDGTSGADANIYRNPKDVLTFSPPRIDVGYIDDRRDHSEGAMSLFFSDNKTSGVFCGGALIARNTILTVARCAFNNLNAMYRYVHVAEATVDRGDALVDLWYETSQIIEIHPKFDINDSRFTANLAKLILPVNILVTDVIDVYADYDMPHRNLVLVGYGRDESKPNRNLRYMEVEIASNATCVAVYGPSVCSRILPTVGKHPFYDNTICRVESGAPLIQKRAILRNRLIGLASHVSFGNCEIGNVDGHVFLSRYYRWIFGRNQFAIYI